MNKDKLNTLVLGLEHFIDKIGYQASEYTKNKISVKYLVSDKSNTSGFYAKKYSADVEVVSGNKFVVSLLYLFKIAKLKPDFVELYDTGNMFLVYLIICFILRRKVIVIYRGGELQRHNCKKFSLNYVKHVFATTIAFKVVAKESNIIEEYKKNGFPLKKLRYLHNCVPMCLEYKPQEERSVDLLFLNSIRKSRNVPFFINVVEKLREQCPDIKVFIAGFNSLDDKNLSFELAEEEYILNLIKNKDLQNSIKVFGFVKDPIKYHIESKLFVFPAEVVFANYSLLESMASGCVPIVSNGEGAEKIVTGEEGSIIELDIDKWVDVIANYLSNNELLQQKSIQARRKIEMEFSMGTWFKKMMELRQD